MALPLSERKPPAPKPPAKQASPSGGRFDTSSLVADARKNLSEELLRASAPKDYTQFTPGAQYVSGVQVTKPALDEGSTRVETAQNMLAEALRAQREAAIGDGEQSLHQNIRKQVDRMTPEEYEALSPIQRAAVDFNGLLVQAVRKDRRNQDEYKPTEEQRQVYDMSVEKIFGSDGGSEMYAPETLGLLRQLDIKDKSGDLDDFLGLKAVVRTEDLEGLARPSAPPAATGGVAADSQMSDVDFDKLGLQRNLAEQTQSLTTTLTRGNQLLQSLGALARVERSNDVSRNLGGLQNNVQTMLGYGSSTDAEGSLTVDGYFQRSFDLLASKSGDKDKILAAMAADLSPEELDAFMVYADNRASQAANYGLELGQAEGVKYRKPEEFRKLLGLGKEAAR